MINNRLNYRLRGVFLVISEELITLKQLADELNTTNSSIAYRVRIISNMKADDDIIPQLEKEFSYSYNIGIDIMGQCRFRLPKKMITGN